MNKVILVSLVVVVLVLGAIGGYLYLTRTQKSETTTNVPSSFPNPFTTAPTPTFANPFATPTYQNPFSETGDSESYQNPFEKLR